MKISTSQSKESKICTCIFHNVKRSIHPQTYLWLICKMYILIKRFLLTLFNILSPRTHIQIISHLLYPVLNYSHKRNDMGNMCIFVYTKNHRKDNYIMYCSILHNILVDTLQLIIIWVMNKCNINKIK